MGKSAARRVAKSDVFEFDYLIVGAGSAGCVMAERLSALPGVTVALLEAGPGAGHPAVSVPAAYPRLFGTARDWDYRTSPQPGLAGREVHWPAGRMLGGSSALNAQMWIRGHREDYDAWEQAAAGWSYDRLEPYFRRAERHTRGRGRRNGYGADGRLPVESLRDPNPATGAFLRACAELGLPGGADLNASDHTGYGAVPVTQHRGRRVSAADGYLRAARRRRSLSVLTGVRVQRIALSRDRASGSTRAYGVEGVDRRGENLWLVARREVILCAGAIGSPHLLMLSGIGDPLHLAEHGIDVRVPLRGVGRGLQDHLAAALVVPCPRPITLAPRALSVQALTSYVLWRRGPLTSNLCEAAAFVHSRRGLPAPDLELGFLPVAHAAGPAPRTQGHAVTLAAVLLQPKSRGRIMLRGTDPASAPVVDPGYLTDAADEDIRTLIDGLRMAARLLSTGALAPFADARNAQLPDFDDDAALARFVRAHADTAHHPVGSCQMGFGEYGVVDGELRVHGVDGLRVIDASVMPTITRGHTHAPTVAIAERAADLIAGSGTLTHELLRTRSGGGCAGSEATLAEAFATPTPRRAWRDGSAIPG